MRRALLLVSLTLTGCAADLGAGGGVEATSPHAIALSRVAMSTRFGTPMNEHGVLVGAEVDSRTEYREGSRFTGGVMFGGGFGPATVGGSPFGFEGHVDFGTTLGDTFFRRGSFYGGGAVAFPLRLSEARQISDLNESTAVLARRFELVPLIRGRSHVDFEEGSSAFFRLDFAFILSMRLRTTTDLF